MLLPGAPKAQPPPRGCWGRPGAVQYNRRPSSRLRSKALAVWITAHAWHCTEEEEEEEDKGGREVSALLDSGLWCMRRQKILQKVRTIKLFWYKFSDVIKNLSMTLSHCAVHVTVTVPLIHSTLQYTAFLFAAGHIPFSHMATRILNQLREELLYQAQCYLHQALSSASAASYLRVSVPPTDSWFKKGGHISLDDAQKRISLEGNLVIKI